MERLAEALQRDLIGLPHQGADQWCRGTVKAVTGERRSCPLFSQHLKFRSSSVSIRIKCLS